VPQLIVLVVHDPTKADEVGEAWVEAGVTGLTLLDSSGWEMRAKSHGVPDDLPLFPSMRRFLRGDEEASRLLFSVVGDDFDLEPLIRATEGVLGPLAEPDSGILFVVPVTQARGLRTSS
jgi:nitrogen regulatory protein PII